MHVKSMSRFSRLSFLIQIFRLWALKQLHLSKQDYKRETKKYIKKYPINRPNGDTETKIYKVLLVYPIYICQRTSFAKIPPTPFFGLFKHLSSSFWVSFLDKLLDQFILLVDGSLEVQEMIYQAVTFFTLG